ncbi:TetR/AcrR family transcriptional regulator [Parasphingorhabdus pacifica]
MVEREGRTPAGQRLLAAASELFYRHGINAIGVAAVAESAGVTKKTLYDCYGSKDRLVAAYLESRHTRWWNYLEQRLVEAEPLRVLALYRAYLHHPDVDRLRGCAFLNAAAELPPEHPGVTVIRRHKTEVRRKLTELVAEDRPQLDDHDAVAEQLFLLLEGAVAQNGIDGDTTHLHRAEALATALLTAER